MARGVNKVILIGNLGRDPEVRHSAAGNPITHFSMATTDSWRDRQTNETQERTEWHNVVCFSRLAEIADQYLRKGSKVYIEGSLRTSSWERDGQTRYRTEVIAREMQMLDSRGDGGDRRGSWGGDDRSSRRSDRDQGYNQDAGGASGRDRAATQQPATSDLDDEDDDLPF